MKVEVIDIKEEAFFFFNKLRDKRETLKYKILYLSLELRNVPFGRRNGSKFA